MRFLLLFSTLASFLVTQTTAGIFSGSAIEGFEEAANFQAEQVSRLRDFLGPVPEEANHNVKRESAIAFRNPKARKFFVDGTKIPDGMLIKPNIERFEHDNHSLSELRCWTILLRSHANLWRSQRNS